jgi:Flp pilus assembly protein TadG
MKAVLGDTRGAAAVEFALVLSPLLALLMGIFFVGWGLHCGGEVRHAVERASRLYVVDRDATEAAFRSAVADNLRSVSADSIDLSVTRREMESGAELVDIAWSYGHSVQLPLLPDQNWVFAHTLSVPRPPPA